MILGAGPAGITAALYGQRMGLKTIVFGDIPGGSSYMIEHLANFPGLMEGTSGTQFGTMVTTRPLSVSMSTVKSIRLSVPLLPPGGCPKDWRFPMPT